MKLLCLSNGHGEDAIALQILQALDRYAAQIGASFEPLALPIVGEGSAYRAHHIPIAGATRSLPSGGFVYMDGRQLWRDVRGGLVGLTGTQLRVVRRWAQDTAGTVRLVLAVGDIVPLAFAWQSGGPYGFVGTAKSEYYLRDEAGHFLRSRRLEGWSGSVYLPWERWLMQRSRCWGVFPRDRLTAEILARLAVPAFDCGNPMMDGLTVPPELPPCPHPAHPLKVLLLPGSRSPEAYRNWAQLVPALTALARDRTVNAWPALVPSLQRDRLRLDLTAAGWQSDDAATYSLTTERGRSHLTLAGGNFADLAQRADLAIAMAGTATEQFVGLGKPAIALPGQGPQFTPAFAEAQTRLLGDSVQLVTDPTEVPARVAALLQDPEQWRRRAASGRLRLGPPGAAARIAERVWAIASVAAKNPAP
jgi:uncharacterized protein (TIGR03492 family)